MTFDFILPVNLHFGRGKLELLGELSAKYGKKVMLVSGSGSIKKSGVFDRVTKLLMDSGLEYVVFDSIPQNPLTTTAIEGADMAKQNGCDVIVGIGGGSVLDCSKAIAFLALNNGDINDYIYGRDFGYEALPIILIPTTCGTGSEGNGFSVLTNPENGDKKSLRTNAIIPKESIIDSTLMETVPKKVLAASGVDALCHCMEAYVSKITQPIIEALAVKGIELISHALPILYKDNGELDIVDRNELWDSMCIASTIGGMIINNAGVVLPHAMEHPVSGLKNVVHGQGLAALTPVIVEASIDGAKEKYAVISRILGGSDETDCSYRIKELLKNIDLNVSLSELGITSSDIPWMCENCLKVSSAGVNNHPKLFSKDEIYSLYYRAL